MAIRYSRSALLSQCELQSFFDDSLWLRYTNKEISYDRFCSLVRGKITDYLQDESSFLAKMISYWNPALLSLIKNANLNIVNKKSNDMVKTVFAYLYRAACSAEYGNMFGIASKVNISSGNSDYRIVFKRDLYDDYSDDDVFFKNPSICYAGDSVYYIYQADTKEFLRKIPLSRSQYQELAEELDHIVQLDEQMLKRYIRLGLILKKKTYDPICDIVNCNFVNFNYELPEVENVIRMFSALLDVQHTVFTSEKRKIIDMIKAEEDCPGEGVFLIAFLAEHSREILELRKKRECDSRLMKYHFASMKHITHDERKMDVYFSIVPDELGGDYLIKIENAAPAAVFSSRMDAIFNEETRLDEGRIQIGYVPEYQRFFHTLRTVRNPDSPIINVNGNFHAPNIAFGELRLSVRGEKIVVMHKNRVIEPVYLSTYNASNSIALMLFRMISYCQEEFYIPENGIGKFQSEIEEFPPIRQGRMLIIPRRWCVPTKVLPDCKTSLLSEAEYSHINYLFHKNNISRFIYAYTDDRKEHKRIIDTHNPFSCVQLKKYCKGSHMIVEEIIMPSDNERMTQFLWESDQKD